MNQFFLQLDLSSVYSVDVPTLEVLVDGIAVSSILVESNGVTNLVIEFPDASDFPASLQFRFDDGLPESGRSITLNEVRVNNQLIDASDITQSVLLQGNNSTLDTLSNALAFGQIAPTQSDLGTPTLTGNGNDNVNLNGSTEADIIDGAGGNDRIRGRDNDDAINGGDGNDFIFGESGSDTIIGGLGNDIIFGGDDDDFLYGEDGDDSIIGGAGADFINGGIGVDFLIGDAGNDTILGGDGDDFISGLSGDDVILGDDGNDTIAGGDGNDTIVGGDGDDFITGEAGEDTVFAGDGADTILLGVGRDALDAGAGNDIIQLFNGDFAAGETIFGGADTDEIVFLDAITVDFSQGSINTVEQLTGSASGDVVTILDRDFAGFTTLDLEGGSDVLNVFAANDISALGTPSVQDTEIGNLIGDSNDNEITINGAQLNAIINGDGVIDLGGGTNDTINLTTTSNDLNTLGNTDADILGVEFITALPSATGVSISLTNQTEDFTVTGGDFNDTLNLGTGNDTINGGDGNDNISGRDGNDIIDGGIGDNTLNGNNGNDLFIDSGGNDVINGGGDIDTITYASALGGITVNLDTTASQDTMNAGTDRISNVENVIGSNFDDVIQSNGSANVIEAGEGNDIIVVDGRDGFDDTYDGGNGFDVIRNFHVGAPQGANESIFFDTETTFISIEEIDAQNQEIRLGNGTTIDFTNIVLTDVVDIFASNTHDNVTGSAGDDVILGRNGNDIIDGGEGNDTIEAGANDDTVTGGEGDDIIRGGSGVDVLNGNNGNDIFQISGTEGIDDTFNGGDGIDTLLNITTNTITFDSETTFNSIEILDGNNEIVQVSANTTIDFSPIASTVNVLRFQGNNGGNETITGTQVDDIIFGQNGNDILNGGEGNDTLNGGNNDDILTGGNGNDILVGGGGVDILNGDAGNDVFEVSGTTARDDTFNGGADNDVIRNSGTGNITFNGSTIFNSIEEIDGNGARINIDAGSVVDFSSIITSTNVSEIRGNNSTTTFETITGTQDDDFINGQNGNDILNGADGDDILNSGNGNDTLNGGLGNDTLRGNGTGANILNGDEGNDIFDARGLEGRDNTFNGGDGNDIIVNTTTNALNFNSGTNFIDVEEIDGNNEFINIDVGSTVDFSSITTSTDVLLIRGNNSSTSGETITGTQDDDAIDGRNGNDVLNGFTGNDDILGGGGDDIIVGGVGSDTLTGGSGNDTILSLDSSVSGASGVSITVGADILNATFDSGLDGFTFSDGGFGGSDPAGGDFARDTSTAGALQLTIDDNGTDTDQADLSGSFDIAFSLTEATDNVTLEFDYVFNLAANFEANEGASVFVELDGTAFGVEPNNFVFQMFGDGNGGTADIVSNSASINFGTLSAGSYNLSLGGFLNAFTFGDEVFTLSFDNVVISEALASSGATLPGIDADSTSTNILDGGDGNDILIGSSGADTLLGGDGNDELRSSSTQDLTVTDIEITDLSQLDSYAGQDVNPTESLITDGFTLDGNSWKSVSGAFTITTDTILEFEFRSVSEGEIHGIGFDFDNTLSGAQTIQLYGTQSFGVGGATYTDIGNFQSFSLNVSDFLGTGVFDRIFFVNDDDANSSANSSFRNIRIVEPSGTSINTTTLNGGEGQDDLFGSLGEDIFVFENASDVFTNPDTVHDFSATQGDTLDISDILSGTGANAGNIASFVDVSEANGLRIDTSGSGSFSAANTAATFSGTTDVLDAATLLANTNLII